MSWGKIDDQLHAHPKAYEAGLEAMGLWTLCLSHCSAFLTDGFVSTVTVTRIGSPHGVELAERLVAAGLWDKVKGGFCFHDYLDHNPSAAEVKEARRQAKERQARKRKRGTESPPPSTRDRRSDRTIADSVTRDNQRDSRVSHIEVTPHVTRESHPLSRVSHTAPTRPDPIREETHTQRGREGPAEPPPSPPSAVRPIRPPVPIAIPPSRPLTGECLEIFQRLESHACLDRVANERQAERILGRRMTSGKPLTWILAAIDDVARDAESRVLSNTPWSTEVLIDKLIRYTDNAEAPRTPRPAPSPNASHSRPNNPADAPPTYQLAEGAPKTPSMIRKEREEREAAAGGTR